MAEALVSTTLQQIDAIINGEAKQRPKMELGLEKELLKLSRSLQAIQPVLEDAERRQLKDATVREWLNSLKDVCFYVDDTLDEWSTAILKWEIEGSEPSSPCFFPNEIANKIAEASERLIQIAEEKDMYSFRLIGKKREELEPPVSESYVDMSRIYCRDHDKKTIVGMLLNRSSDQEVAGISLITIVGMAGVGKTTLARLAYDDDEVKAHFDERVWASVSDPFVRTRVARALATTLSGASPNPFRVKFLSEKFVGKRFLLVLDDVQTDDFREWISLRQALNCGAPGSRILVTTRKNCVAHMMETTHLFPLQKLSQEECWSLFSQVAFYGRDGEECEELTEIGRKIAEKCKGLPFAARILGGLIQFKRSREEWHDILSSELWEQEEEGIERELFTPLLLSYYDLPAAIRQCFLYCAMFPKHYVMEKCNMISLWMAQGYLSSTPSKEIELVGEDYFRNLAVRSFFQDFDKWGLFGAHALRFKMHGIVHEFAQFLTRNECFVSDGNGLDETRIDFRRVRHSTVMLAEEGTFPASSDNAENLRSLLIIKSTSNAVLCETPRIDAFHRLKSLRSLTLNESLFNELPGEVETLMHLRHLDLSGNSELMTLSETVTNLYNLQYLGLDGCERLGKLPQGMGKLTKLKHLKLFDTYLSFLPKGIERLSSLQSLTSFVVCADDNETDAADLGALEKLDRLGGDLLIDRLGYVRDVNEALRANLKKKKNLIFLELRFTAENVELPMNDDAVIEALEPPSGLEQLHIHLYRGIVFPGWIMSLTKLKDLLLQNCRTYEKLPPLGLLPSLEKLSIGVEREQSLRKLDVGLLGIERVGEDNHNRKQKKCEGETSRCIAFPKLKELEIMHLEGLEEWDGIGKTLQGKEIEVMPQLRVLDVYECQKLKALPDYILKAQLEELRIIGCPALRNRYEKVAGEDWYQVSHILNIKFDF